MSVQIEPASIHDADVILELQKEAFSGQAKIYNNFSLPPLLQTLDAIQLEFKEKKFLKARIGNQIIGSVRYKVTGKSVTIHRLIVKPEYHGNGIGLSLLNHVEKMSRKNHILKLFTGNKSVRNIHLYEKAGFKTIKTEMTDIGIKILHMEKKL